MSWDTIVGQSRVKTLLKRAIESHRLPHAYLFHGPDGVGKDAMALELAKVVNCERGGSTACGQCESCRQLSSLQHPNLKLIFPLPLGRNERAGDPPLAKLDASDVENVREQIRLKAQNPYHAISVPRATTIKVNSIRDVRREASLTAYRRGKKVIVIIDAEHMNDEAANALLKTLEEPMDDTLFILTTSYRDRLFPTIISRCQEIRFDVLSEHDIIGYLTSAANVEPSQAALTARLAHGSLARALELLGVDLHEQREAVLEFLRILSSASEYDIATYLEELSRDYDKEEIQRFLHLLQLWLRDALCLEEEYESIINIDQKENIRRFVKQFQGTPYSVLMASADRALSLISKNAYIPLVLTVLAQHVRSHLVKQ